MARAAGQLGPAGRAADSGGLLPGQELHPPPCTGAASERLRDGASSETLRKGAASETFRGFVSSVEFLVFNGKQNLKKCIGARKLAGLSKKTENIHFSVYAKSALKCRLSSEMIRERKKRTRTSSVEMLT